MLCISIKIRTIKMFIELSIMALACQRRWKKYSHSMIPKAICFNSFKHFNQVNQLHHFTVFQFYSFKTINVRAILMLSDRQLTNAIKVKGINRKKLTIDDGWR